MPYCTKCGHQNADGDRFCSGCGAALDGAAERTMSNKTINKNMKYIIPIISVIIVVIIAIIVIDPGKITIGNEKYPANSTALDLSRKNLSEDDLKKISKFKELTDLNLSDNNIWDLSALYGMTGLETLDISGNPILGDSQYYLELDEVVELQKNLSDTCIYVEPMVNLTEALINNANNNAKLTYVNVATYLTKCEIKGNSLTNDIYVFELDGSNTDYIIKGNGSPDDFRKSLSYLMGNSDYKQYVYICMKNGYPNYVYWSKSSIFSADETDPDGAYRSGISLDRIVGSYPIAIEY